MGSPMSDWKVTTAAPRAWIWECDGPARRNLIPFDLITQVTVSRDGEEYSVVVKTSGDDFAFILVSGILDEDEPEKGLNQSAEEMAMQFAEAIATRDLAFLQAHLGTVVIEGQER